MTTIITIHHSKYARMTINTN